MTKDEFVEAIAKKGNFLFDLSWYAEYFVDLTDAEIGQIMRGICEYVQTGELKRFDDRGLNVIARAMTHGIQKCTESYIERCAKNRNNGSAGGKAKAANQHQPEMNAEDIPIKQWAAAMEQLRQQ